MALKYVVKKTTFGFDKEKAEKYVARPFNVVTVDFKMLCDQVTKVGFVPRGTVKSVLDGLIDSLITYMEIGFGKPWRIRNISSFIRMQKSG
jgi:hypothetical protein